MIRFLRAPCPSCIHAAETPDNLRTYRLHLELTHHFTPEKAMGEAEIVRILIQATIPRKETP